MPKHRHGGSVPIQRVVRAEARERCEGSRATAHDVHKQNLKVKTGQRGKNVPPSVALEDLGAMIVSIDRPTHETNCERSHAASDARTLSWQQLTCGVHSAELEKEHDNGCPKDEKEVVLRWNGSHNEYGLEPHETDEQQLHNVVQRHNPRKHESGDAQEHHNEHRAFVELLKGAEEGTVKQSTAGPNQKSRQYQGVLKGRDCCVMTRFPNRRGRSFAGLHACD